MSEPQHVKTDNIVNPFILTENEKLIVQSMTGKVPTVILSGFLGSGKTTFVQTVLKYQQDHPDHSIKHVGFLVNDASELNIDEKNIK